MNIVNANLEHSVSGRTVDSICRSFGDMPISAFFIRLLVLLTFWAYAAVWTTGYMREMLVLLAVPLLFMGIRAQPLNTGRLFLKLASVLALIFAAYERTGSIPGVIILLNFACMILILQLLVLDSIRAANGVLILSLMIILAVAAMNVNFIFPMVLIPYLITFYLVLKQLAILRHAIVSTRGSAIRGKSEFSLKSFLANGVATFIIFSCFWLVIFYLIPRNESFGIASETSRRRLKGFSDTLSIGEAGLLEDNPAVILRVMPLDEKTLTPSILRRIKNKPLRGASFATYNNGNWERGAKRRWFIDTRKNSGEIILRRDLHDFRELHQLELILENIDPPVVFVPDETVSISFSVPFVSVEDDQSLYFVKRASGSRRYLATVIADAGEATDSEVSQIVVNKEIRIYATKSGIPEKVLALSKILASGTTTINQRVEKTVSFIQRQCSYSLRQLPSRLDPVEDFLFDGKSGTCEHFATALVLLLRAMDIPARPVGGYTMGDWNEIGNFFTIRQRHAHAWVEVYYPESGWVSFDPTPAAQEFVYDSEIGKMFETLWETYEGYWFSYVYNFDNRVQTLGYRKISSAVSSSIGFFILMLSSKGFLAFLLACSIILYTKWPLISRRIRRKDSWIPCWYYDWEKRQSQTRLSWETPSEYHRRLYQLKMIDNESMGVLIQLEQIIDECAFARVNDQEILQKRAKELLGQIRIR